VFDFLENQPFELRAYADTHVLDVQLPTEQTASFLLELAGQPAAKIIFPEAMKCKRWVSRRTSAAL
jgi:hypothetical protein